MYTWVDGNMAVSLLDAAKQLERNLVKDQVQQLLTTRPGAEELEQLNILHGRCSL